MTFASLLSSSQDEPRIFVESEDEPDRVLLETKISRDDSYQKQQGAVLVPISQPSHGEFVVELTIAQPRIQKP